MLISLEKVEKPHLFKKVAIRLKSNSDDINQLKELILEQRKVILDHKIPLCGFYQTIS